MTCVDLLTTRENRSHIKIYGKHSQRFILLLIMYDHNAFHFHEQVTDKKFYSGNIDIFCKYRKKDHLSWVSLRFP